MATDSDKKVGIPYNAAMLGTLIFPKFGKGVP